MNKDFRSELVQSELIEIPGGKGTPKTFRAFERIAIGSFNLSIQASPCHYCHPKQMLPVEKYEMWEVCLFEGPDEATVNVFQDPRFFDIHSPNWATVGAYILTADVQVLYERLWEMTVLGD